MTLWSCDVLDTCHFSVNNMQTLCLLGGSSLCGSQDLLSHYGSPVRCVTELGQVMLLFGTSKLEQKVQGQRARFNFTLVVRSKTPAVSSGEGDG